jgi:excisionase family DNA binding protein
MPLQYTAPQLTQPIISFSGYQVLDFARRMTAQRSLEPIGTTGKYWPNCKMGLATRNTAPQASLSAEAFLFQEPRMEWSEKWMRVREVAAMLNMPLSSVYLLISSEALPHTRVSRKTIRVSEAAVLEYMRARSGAKA